MMVCDKMVMGKNDYDNWQQLFWEAPFAGGIAGACPAVFFVVCQLCFGGHWCLGGTLVVVLGVMLMFWWCFCGVVAVFRWCRSSY